MRLVSLSVHSWIRDLCKGVAGNCSETETPNLQCVLKCGKKKARIKGVAGKMQQAIEIQIETTGLEYHNLQVTDYEYVEKVFKNLRYRLNRSENFEMFDSKTNVLIWGLFMSTTMKSAVHLGCENQQNLIACSFSLDESSNQVGEKQKCMSTQIHCCVWERCMIIQKRMKSGKARSVYSDKTKSMHNYLELMENHLSSSGVYHRIHID